MLFTICIPTFNRANTILRTIQSLDSQTYQDFEVLIIDDGSTDNTKELISEFNNEKIRYIYKENGGKHTALNTALDRAKGELFLILDSDDQLLPNALEKMSSVWVAHKDEVNCCGVMGRCVVKGKLIGEPFDEDEKTLTYIDFHFGKRGGAFKDCCECIKTEVINRYRWPVNLHTKFVPESLVTDKIGLKYYMICVNDIFEEKEYLDGGITKLGFTYKKKNAVGYLYNSVSKIDEIFPNTNIICIKKRIETWWEYWNLVSFDVDGFGPRVCKITFLGMIVKLLTPMINIIKKRH